MAVECDLGAMMGNDWLRVELVRGVNDTRLQKRLLQEQQATLPQMVLIAKQWQVPSAGVGEDTVSSSLSLCEGAALYHAHTVDTLEDEAEVQMARLGAMKQPTQRRGYFREWIRCGIQQEFGVVILDPHADCCVRVGNDGSERGPRHNQLQVDRCQGCGAHGDKMHERHACPATNRSCFNCGIDGHFGRMCRKSLRPRNDCMTEPDKDPDPTPVIEDIKIFPSDGGVPFTFRMRLDTGCAVSLISEDVVTRQGLTVDTTSSKRIRTADGQDLDNSGTVTFGVGFQGKTTEVVAAHGGYT